MKKVILAVTLLATLLTGCGFMMGDRARVLGFKAHHKEYRETVTQEYQVGETPHIVLRNPQGDVQIAAWTENKVKLTATKVVRALTAERAIEYAKRIKIETELKDNRLQIAAEPSIWEEAAWRKIDYELLVPEAVSLDIRTSHGEVVVGGSKAASATETPQDSMAMEACPAPVKIINSHGRITVRDIAANFDITNQHGEIALSNIQGSSAVQSSWAKIKVSHVLGDVALKTQHKPILIDNVKGNVTVSNSHAPVKVRCVEGHLSITNQHADVAADSVRGGISISNSHGDIRVRVLGRMEDEYSLRAQHGDIVLELCEE